MVGYLQPLAHNFAIVNELGYPTEYFIRWAQQKQIDIEGSITEATAKEIVAQFLDDISTTQGSIMFRGEDQWEALPPGPPGQVLSTNGPDADPLWIPQSGGGEVSVELNGVEIVPSASILNFVGGVTVTDGGSGEAIINVSGGGGSIVPSIVQSKAVALSNISAGIALDLPPVQGNWLIALILNSTGATPPAASSGWTSISSSSTLPDHNLVRRLVGPGESSLQTPTSTSEGGVLLIYEVTGTIVTCGAVAIAAVSPSANIPFTSNGEYLPNSTGLLIGFSGRRLDESGPVWTGSLEKDTEVSGAAAITGGAGVSASSAIGVLTLNGQPSSSCVWPTSSATLGQFVLVS